MKGWFLENIASRKFIAFIMTGGAIIGVCAVTHQWGDAIFGLLGNAAIYSGTNAISKFSSKGVDIEAK